MDAQDDFDANPNLPVPYRPDKRHNQTTGVWMPEEISLLALDDIRLPDRSLRRHPKKQIRKIAKSIERNGFIIPVAVDAKQRLVAGIARYLAAKELGLPYIPCIEITHLSEAQLRAFRLFDNRIAEEATWNEDELALELAELKAFGIDLETTGFEIPEIDLIIETRFAKPHDIACDELPALTEAAISRSGDIWILDEHRIGCGDARDQVFMRRLMNSACATTGFNDPPYNVEIDGHVSGLGKVAHREFAMASGEMSDEEFCSFLQDSLKTSLIYLVDGALLYVCMDWRHLETLLVAGRALGLSLFNLCVWAKTNAGMGSFYRSQHELVVVFKKGHVPHRNNIELGKYGRNRSNVWSYAGMNSFGAKRDEELRWHPTVKPVRMIADALLDCTAPGDIVLDAFLGSGSTLIAAEDVGRLCYGVEIDPLYVDLIIRRWEALTGDTAIHAITGLTFSETAAGQETRLLPAPKTDEGDFNNV